MAMIINIGAWVISAVFAVYLISDMIKTTKDMSSDSNKSSEE